MKIFAYGSHLIHKYSRIPYLFYKISGFFDKFKPLWFLFEDVRHLVVVGKGASLAEIPHNKLEAIFDGLNLKVLVGSVDINNHPILSRQAYDLQMVGRIDSLNGHVPVYDKDTLVSFGIKSLCVNTSCSYMSGLPLYRFYQFFHRLGLGLYHTDGGISFVSENASDYGGIGLTIVQKVISHALMAKKMESITFLGVDFYGTGYLDSLRNKQEDELSLFPNIEDLSESPRVNRGIPLVKYLIALANSPQMSIQLKFPSEILKYVPNTYRQDFVNAKWIQIV